MNQELSLDLWQELGAEIVCQPEYVCLFSGIPNTHFNKVALRTRKEPDPKLIKEICSRFKEKNLPFHWLLPSSLSSLRLQEALAEQAVYPATEIIRMSATLGSSPYLVPESQIRITQADTEEKLQAALLVYSECYKVHEEQAKAFFTLSPERHFQFYLATYLKKPVGCGSLLISRNSATIFNIGTTLSARNQGVATQMMHHLLYEAQKKGKTFILLNAMPRAVSIYAKIGFVDVERYQLYVSLREQTSAGTELFS